MSRLIAVIVLACAGPAAAQSYRIDPTHSFVTFEAGHFDTSTLRGRFDRTEGSVVIDRQARAGKAEVVIAVGSVSTGVGPLDTHLKGEDFLDAARSPQASFVGDAFRFDGDKLAAVSGTLTLRGQSHPVTLKATHFGCYTNPLLKREVCGGDFETTIARSQWGMTRGVAAGVPDRIRLLIQVEAIKQ